jgi:hypothetical protein
LLPHEIAFGLLWSVTAVRLFLHGGRGFGWGLLLATLMLASWSFSRWTNRQPNERIQRIRLLAYLPLMVITYKLLGQTVPLLHPGSSLLLSNADRWLLGQDAGCFFEPLTSPVLTDLFFCLYLGLFVIIGAAFWHYSHEEIGRFRRFGSGLFTIYSIGFLGYTLIPAGGPYLEIPDHFTVALTGSWLTRTADWLVRTGTNRVDCFPCLHLGVSLYILTFDFWYCRRRFWWQLGPCIGIWISTIYLRQHYAVDLIGGVILTVVVLARVRPRPIEEINNP